MYLMTQLLLVLVTHKVHSTANPQALHLMTQLMLVLMTHKVDSMANLKNLYLMTQLTLVLVTHKVNSTANPKAWTLHIFLARQKWYMCTTFSALGAT